MDQIELAVRRARTQRPELGRTLEIVADALWAGEDVDLAHQASVQSFLWWQVPRRYDPGDWDNLAEAAAVLLDEAGRGRLADIARSPRTAEVLAAWREDADAGVSASRSAVRASGVEAPDTGVLAWGSVMGSEEANALDAVERALGDAVASGELVPGRSGSQVTARRSIGLNGAATDAIGVVNYMAEGYRAAQPATHTLPDGAVVDPVCGMHVRLGPRAITLQHGENLLGFCSSGCRAAYADEHQLEIL